MRGFTGTSYKFKHMTGNRYDIYGTYGEIYLAVLAFGLTGIVVDKHRTVLMRKETTNIDRFDLENVTLDSVEQTWWYAKEGPHKTTCDGRLNAVLSQIATHYERVIAKLILE